MHQESPFEERQPSKPEATVAKRCGLFNQKTLFYVTDY